MQNLETYKTLVKTKKEVILADANRLGFKITYDDLNRPIINYVPTEHLNLIMKIEKRRVLTMIQIMVSKWAEEIEKSRIGVKKELYEKYPYIKGHEKEIIEILRELFDLDNSFDIDHE